MRRFEFSGRLRLRSRVDFDRVFRQCERSSDHLFTVLARRNDKSHPRLGLVVSRKSAGNAVARHRIKRLVRERFRLSQHRLPPADFVVIARPGLSARGNPELEASLDRHWRRLADRCAH